MRKKTLAVAVYNHYMRIKELLRTESDATDRITPDFPELEADTEIQKK